MEYYRDENVSEAAKNRIRYLFDEFEIVCVAFSGGKDSTVTLNLAIEIAREKNRLPIKVLFIDQEAEWDNNIQYIRDVMNMPEVEPMWFQIPLKIFNATSTIDVWLECWKPGAESEWLRPKEEISIKENRYGTDRFAKLFSSILKVEFKGKRVAMLGGIRTEESPSRKLAMTVAPTYKWITWGKKHFDSEQHFTFYPIYDWSYTDIWKAIHDNKWQYCKIYDYMYNYGVPVKNMRVSNVHHETAIKSLYIMQEIEKENWNKLTARLSGVSSAGYAKDSLFFVDKLPYMFESWREYRDYLLEKLISDEETKRVFQKAFNNKDSQICYDLPELCDEYCKATIAVVLKNDYNLTTYNNFFKKPDVAMYVKFKKGHMKNEEIRKSNKYVQYELERSNKKGV